MIISSDGYLAAKFLDHDEKCEEEGRDLTFGLKNLLAGSEDYYVILVADKVSFVTFGRNNVTFGRNKVKLGCNKVTLGDNKVQFI